MPRRVVWGVFILVALVSPAALAWYVAAHFGVLSSAGLASILAMLVVYVKLAVGPRRRPTLPPPAPVRGSIDLASSEIARSPARYGPNSGQVALFLDRLPLVSDQQWKHIEQVYVGSMRGPIGYLARVVRQRRIPLDVWRAARRDPRREAEAALRDALSLDVAAKQANPLIPTAYTIAATYLAAHALLYRDVLDAEDFARFYAPFADVIPLVHG